MYGQALFPDKKSPIEELKEIDQADISNMNLEEIKNGDATRNIGAQGSGDLLRPVEDETAMSNLSIRNVQLRGSGLESGDDGYATGVNSPDIRVEKKPVAKR